MLELIARFSPRLRAVLDLPGEVSEAFEAARAVLTKYSNDPEVQAALNEISDVRTKINAIIGRR